MMFDYLLIHLIFFTSLLLAALPPNNLETAPWGTPECFPVVVTPAIKHDDCVTVIEDFIFDHRLPHYTYTRTRPPRPQPNIIVCPWLRTHRTCTFKFNIREGLPEQHETAWVVARAMFVTKYCAGKNQIGGRMRIGDSLIVSVMQSQASGPLGYLMEGDLWNGTSPIIGSSGQNLTS